MIKNGFIFKRCILFLRESFKRCISLRARERETETERCRVYVGMYTLLVSADAYGCQKRVLDPQELEVQVVVKQEPNLDLLQE